MKKSRIFCLSLCALFTVISAAGCFGGNPDDNDDNDNNTPTEKYVNVDYTPSHSATTRFVNFASTDAGLDAFLNEYAERHMRDNSTTRVGNAAVGNTTRAAWREWDSLIGGWWDASAQNGTMSQAYATNDAVNAWLELDESVGVKFPDYRSLVDNQGYIWGEANMSLSSWGMGWDFPDYRKGGKAWDFAAQAELSDWTVETSGVTASIAASKLKLDTSTNLVDEISVSTTKFNVKPCYTPFLRIGFSYAATASYDLDDLYVEWQTSDDATWSEDKKVKFSDFCTRGFELGSTMSVEQKDYAFPMYLNEKWGADFSSNRTITALRITLKGVSKFRGTMSLDFVASEFDDRQPINNCNYILAAKNNLEFSRDEELLKTVLPNARKAMNFLLYTLDGKEGLISTEYLVGHFSDRGHATGTGIGNGYWDVDAFPTVNLYCNISFYNALVAMKYLEDMADYYGIKFEEVQTANANMDGFDTYSAVTKSNLNYYISECKNRIQTEFWNEATGRFHVGYYDDGSGEVQDHGYTMFNEMVITSGLATEEQTKSILDWINGERTVKGDNSTGADIYYYEVAPRFNTNDINNDFYWGYECNWDGNVQNGGTALHLTYYDILAQSHASTASSFEKLKKIQAWFEKVKAAGGEGSNFYREYYNNYTNISLQGNFQGHDVSGLLGVDSEFLEAAVVFRSVPDAFFGMSTSAYGTLNFAPSVPSSLDWWRIENLVYAGYYYDVAVSKYFVQISGVDEYSAGSGQDVNLSVSFPVPGFDYAVYVNGVKTSGYSVSGGKITVIVPFDNVKVEIKEI